MYKTILHVAEIGLAGFGMVICLVFIRQFVVDGIYSWAVVATLLELIAIAHFTEVVTRSES